MNIWEPLAGDCLKSRKEPRSEMNKAAVAVICIRSYSEEVVVGHVPKSMSNSIYLCSYSCPIVLWTSLFQLIFIFINWLKNKVKKIEEKRKENVKHCLKLNIEKLLVSAIRRSLLGGNVNQDLKMKSTTERYPL